MAQGNVAADLLVHVGADIKDAQRGLDSIGDKTDGTAKRMRKTSMALGGMGLGVLGFLGGATMAAANFEQGMANINAVADLTAAQFQSLESLALNIGAATSFSATEGAAAIEELVKAGLSVDDVLNGAAMSAAHLAEAGGIGIPEAATVMANSMNLFGLAGSDAARIADVFAAAANASAADVDTLSAALKQGGPAAAMMGMSLEETVAALALFSNYGIQGSDAGTSLKTMLQSLSNPSAEAAAKMQELGINAFDASGNFVGMENLAGQLQTSLGGLDVEARNAALAMIFGADASRVAGILFKAGADGVSEMTEATSKQGAAAEMARKRMDTLQGALEQLKGSAETAMIMLGSSFVPVLRGVADGLTGAVNWFTKIPAPLQKFIGMAIAAAGALLGLGAAITGIIGFGGPAIAGILAIANPIGLLVAAVIGLAIAWRKNFLGIRDITRGVTRPIGKAFGMLIGYFQDVVRGQRILTDSLNAFPEPLRGIIMILGAAVDGVADFIRVISGGGSLREAWYELTDTFLKAPVKDAISGLGGDLMAGITAIPWGDIGNTLWNAFKAGLGMLTDAAEWIVSNLGDLAGKLWEWFSAAVGAVDWGAVFNTAMAWASSAIGWILGKLGDLGSALWTWATDAFSRIPWASIATWATNQIDPILQKLGDLGTGLLGWAQTAFSKIPWGNIANRVTDVTGTIVQKIGNLGVAFKNWYDRAIDNVDWNNLGFIVGQKIGNLARVLGPKAWELITGFGTFLQENWKTIGTVLLGLILGLPATLGYIGATMAPKAWEFVKGFVDGLGVNWGLVGGWIRDNFWKLPLLVPILATMLAPKAWEFLKGFIDGLDINWTSVAAWLIGLGAKATAAVGSLMETMVPRGIQLISGLFRGLLESWPDASSWLGTVGGLALAAVGNVSQTLLNRGIQLLSGLYRGVLNFWDANILPWLKNFGPKASETVGSLLEYLLVRGRQLMTGLKTAASNYWDKTIVPFLESIPSQAQEKVGDLYWTIYYKGEALMRGFGDGIASAGQAAYDKAKEWADKILGLFSDVPFMSPIGHAGMEWGHDLSFGFTNAIIEGLRRGEAEIARSMDRVLYAFSEPLGMNATLSAATAGGEAFGPSNQTSQSLAKVQGDGRNHVTQHIRIDAHFDDVEDMIRAAEFVRTLNTSADMYVSDLEK